MKRPQSIVFWICLQCLIVSGFLPNTSWAGERKADPSPTITVLVFNYSHASPAILEAAEGEAGRIFEDAGLRVAWSGCPRPSGDPPGACQTSLKKTELMLRIVSAPVGKSSQDTAFGTVFGFAAHPAVATVYYEYVVDQAESDDAKFEVPMILGCIVAHEIGHLLLGSNSHSSAGIMQPHWQREQVLQIMRHTLLFTIEQSRLMREQAQTRITQGSDNFIPTFSSPTERIPKDHPGHSLSVWVNVDLHYLQDLRKAEAPSFTSDESQATLLLSRRMEDPSPTVTILVYNNAQAPAATLARTELESGRILGEAGVRAVWIDCLDRNSAADLQELCHKGREPIDVVLRVLPGHIQGRLQDTLFGITFLPTLASVYYEYAERLATSDKEVPTILGCAIAHEIGHLLLGPNSHSAGGIMQGEWGPKQFRLAPMGGLLFTSQQAKLIRVEARRRMNLQTGTPKEQRLAAVDPRAEPRVIPQSD